jgi:hypothetical protein
MHRASLRCSSVKYSLYSPSSRLAIRPPRRLNTSPSLRNGVLGEALKWRVIEALAIFNADQTGPLNQFF